MRYVGADLHKVKTQLCVIDDVTGEVIEKRIDTNAAAFEAFFRRWERCRIVLEASTESEWVARALEKLGHEVIVADPNFAPMYATLSKKVKTDKRDARALAEACQLGAYRPAHRLSDGQRQVSHELTVRDALVTTRSKFISTVRALTRQHGLRVPSGEAETFHVRVQEMTIEKPLRGVLKPLLRMLDKLTQQIARCDKKIAKLGETKETQLMQTIPNIGPVTSVAFAATLDKTERFDTGRKATAYLGLVPGEHSSGEKKPGRFHGPITKRGNARMRWLLVQSAHGILRRRTPANEALHIWGNALATRRGKNIAAVALARRLARIMFAVWRDGVPYNSQRLAPRLSPTIST